MLSLYAEVIFPPRSYYIPLYIFIKLKRVQISHLYEHVDEFSSSTTFRTVSRNIRIDTHVPVLVHSTNYRCDFAGFVGDLRTLQVNSFLLVHRVQDHWEGLMLRNVVAMDIRMMMAFVLVVRH